MAVEETRRRLILTAERLFAEHGFDGVTLKQITTEAGQRNASALQYHFGSKVELVEAIVLHRIPGINERREEMVDRLEAEGRSGDIRGLLEAMIVPLAEQLGTPGRPRYYLGFLAQVYTNPRSGIARMVPGKLDSGARRAGKLARAVLASLPAPVVEQRMALLPWQVVHALADFERFALAHGGGRVSLFISSLIDSLAGALTAPVSQETLTELAQASSKRGRRARRDTREGDSRSAE